MDRTTFIILSFEGPDPYAHAGGLGSRVSGLSESLARTGHETHLFFVGGPDLPGHDVLFEGRLHLHRWCQWISQYHPAGVYDNENGKLADWNASLPHWLMSNVIRPKAAQGESIVVLAEEWHTAESVCHLADLLSEEREALPVRLLWNANNTFGFDRIPWERLAHAATITTVSRYMKHVMGDAGVNARIIPNGIPTDWLEPVDRRGVARLARLFEGRVAATKVARFDPDKRWLTAVDAVAEMKRLGLKPLFLARGGAEEHGQEVLTRAAALGLSAGVVHWKGSSVEALATALSRDVSADMVVLDDYLSNEQRRALFHTTSAVLANSGIEPFGLVGLETMAVGGIAIVGSTGEDYIIPGHDAISLHTSDPREIVHHVSYLQTEPNRAKQIRHAARKSAARYTWDTVVTRNLLPTLDQLWAAPKQLSTLGRVFRPPPALVAGGLA